MRIGFDAKRVFTNFTGLGNYSRFVIGTLSKYYPDNEYILYTPVINMRNGYGHTQQIANLIDRLNISIRTTNSIFRPGRERGWKSPPQARFMGGYNGLKTIWRTFVLAALADKDQCSIYHGLTNELPVGIGKANSKSVVTIHDLLFLRYPEFFPLTDRHIYNYKSKRACAAADKIIAVSEQTKNDIVEFYGTDPRKIQVVYQGCDQVFKQKYSEEKLLEVKRKYELPQDYILNVGRIEKRKNALVILKALKNLRDKEDIPLVIAGKSTGYKKELIKYAAKNGLLNRVQYIHNVSFSDLPLIYQSAKLFVYPSVFEGFGIPVIEALYSGVPVITSKGSCFGEAAGPSSLYVSPDNAGELSDAITKVMFDGSLKKKMVEEGRQYVCRFDDRKLADELVRVYKGIL